MSPHRIFLLSPANAGGERAAMLFRPGASFDLAVRLRREGAPLGEAFAFTSGLYFRGKLAYAEKFVRPPTGVPGVLVIAPGAGLVPAETPVRRDQLVALGQVPVDEADARLLAGLGDEEDRTPGRVTSWSPAWSTRLRRQARAPSGAGRRRR